MKRGLTRVEVLAIVVVLVVAVAIVLPAIGRSRALSRQAWCANNQVNLSLAMLNFEAKQKEFPGFKQPLAGQEVSWTVMLLPYLDRADLWKKWEKGISKKCLMKLMVCSSDSPESASAVDGPSSYAVNTKVCMDGKGLSLDYLAHKDGSTTTLLLSENLRVDKAHNWWGIDPATVGFTDGPMKDNIGSNHSGVVVTAFCDGHIRFLRDDIDDALFKALVTPDGGEHVAEDELE